MLPPEDNVEEDNVEEDNVEEDNVEEDNVEEDNVEEDNVEEDNVEEDNVEEDNVEEDNVEEDNVEESTSNDVVRLRDPQLNRNMRTEASSSMTIPGIFANDEGVFGNYPGDIGGIAGIDQSSDPFQMLMRQMVQNQLK